MNELAGKVGIIMGASRGIGVAAAATLAEEGAAAILVARDGIRASGVADAINAKGGRAVAMACDIADYAGIERLVCETQHRFGDIDILVNNAGVIEPVCIENLVRIAPVKESAHVDGDGCPDPAVPELGSRGLQVQEPA